MVRPFGALLYARTAAASFPLGLLATLLPLEGPWVVFQFTSFFPSDVVDLLALCAEWSKGVSLFLSSGVPSAIAEKNNFGLFFIANNVLLLAEILLTIKGNF